MVPTPQYAGERVVVMGLGKSGLSAAASLRAGGAKVEVWDDKPASLAEGTMKGFNAFDAAAMNLDGVRAVIWSPGVPHSFPRAHALMTELSYFLIERVLHNSVNVMTRQRDELGIDVEIERGVGAEIRQHEPAHAWAARSGRQGGIGGEHGREVPRKSADEQRAARSRNAPQPTGARPRQKKMIGEIAARGVSVLLVEQKLTIALDISQRCYVMGHGEMVFHGTPDELRSDQYVRKEWLEV